MQTARGTEVSNLGAEVVHRGWYTYGVGSGDRSKGYEGRQSWGSVGNARRILEGVATGGNAQEGTGEETIGDLGEISIADARGQ